MGHFVERKWEADFAGLTRRQRSPCRYQAYVPDRLMELRLELPPEMAVEIGEAERAIQHLNDNAPAAATLEAVARLLLRAEAVASSRIEGLVVGPRRLLRAEAARQLGEPVDDATAAAVLGNVEAMAFAVETVAARPHVTRGDLLLIHQRLMEHTDRPDLGGQVRTTQNWIGGNSYNPCGAEFVPPPPEEVPALLDDLVTFLNTDHYPPLAQAALAHAQFETIHPFADGNGRTGRALIHVVLRRRGLARRYVPPISLVLATRVREYLTVLRATSYIGSPTSTEARQGMLTWLDVFVGAAKRATADAEEFGRRIDALVRGWRERVRPFRANSSVDLLLRALPAAPVITVTTASRLINRSFAAVNLAVERLVRAGVLKQTTVGRRNRAYEAVGLVDAFTDFERALASPVGDTRDAPPVRPVPRRRVLPRNS